MTSEMVESTWATIGYFLYQLDPDIRRVVRRLEYLHLKILILFFWFCFVLRHINHKGSSNASPKFRSILLSLVIYGPMLVTEPNVV